MNGTSADGNSQQAEAPLSVPRWTDILSGLQSRHPGISIGLGNLETRLLAERLRSIPIDRPIYITGLARSGTTILLELLALHPELSSHRYRDFPPVLTPWFWNWFVDHAGDRSQATAERAHGDGIEVSAESPEAFEEVIWMAFFPSLHDPNINAVLTAETRNGKFEAFYRDHIRKMLLIRGGRRYLSKANYDLTRIGYLHKLFPDARFVIPIRDPAWHIASLMRQHERFCREHRRDTSLERHMSRGGHFEFGLDRRPINSGNTECTDKVRALWEEGRDVEGWALYWKDLHGYVADTLASDAGLRSATFVVNYDKLCDNPKDTVRALLSHCELAATDIDLATIAAERIRRPSYYRPPFDDTETALIESVTAPVMGRLDAMTA